MLRFCLRTPTFSRYGCRKNFDPCTDIYTLSAQGAQVTNLPSPLLYDLGRFRTASCQQPRARWFRGMPGVVTGTLPGRRFPSLHTIVRCEAIDVPSIFSSRDYRRAGASIVEAGADGAAHALVQCCCCAQLSRAGAGLLPSMRLGRDDPGQR